MLPQGSNNLTKLESDIRHCKCSKLPREEENPKVMKQYLLVSSG